MVFINGTMTMFILPNFSHKALEDSLERESIRFITKVTNEMAAKASAEKFHIVFFFYRVQSNNSAPEVEKMPKAWPVLSLFMTPRTADNKF